MGDLGSIFADAAGLFACFSMLLLIFASSCLLVLVWRVFARPGVEPILNLNSSCLALPRIALVCLALPCLALLHLALPYFKHALSVPLLLRFCLSLGHFFRSCGSFFRLFYAF